jgi:hypothetical protein
MPRRDFKPRRKTVSVSKIPIIVSGIGYRAQGYSQTQAWLNSNGRVGWLVDLDTSPLNMGPIGSPETFVLNQPTLRNITEDDRIQHTLILKYHTQVLRTYPSSSVIPVERETRNFCHLWTTTHNHWAKPATAAHDHAACGATRHCLQTCRGPVLMEVGRCVLENWDDFVDTRRFVQNVLRWKNVIYFAWKQAQQTMSLRYLRSSSRR